MSGVYSRKRAALRTLLAAALVSLLAVAPGALAAEFENDECLDCHEGEEEGEVNPEVYEESVHGETFCVDCHRDATPEHDDYDEPLEKAECSECHADEVDAYWISTHGELTTEEDPDAPDCTFCHGTHETLPRSDPRSRTFPLRVPELCGECHKQGERAAARENSSQTETLQNYTMSIHGRGLFDSGLLVSATCPSCHTAHRELPADDPRSSVHPDNIVATCANCHYGIYEKLRESVHSAEVTETEDDLPGCNDCHTSHTIQRVASDDFRFEILTQCGDCHEELIETYFDTYHGKVSKLGGIRTARCYDCHGSHNILAASEPASLLHEDNIVETCRSCHPGSNARFVQYRPHATHDDRENFPQLYYSFWFMTILLVGTMSFFGIHTVLWLIRTLIAQNGARRKAPAEATRPGEQGIYYRRFQRSHSLLHLLVIISFLSLAFTGMALKYPDTRLFADATRFSGGPEVMGLIHRLGALITFGYFGTHLLMVWRKLRGREITLKGLLKEEYSLLPMWRDVRDLQRNFFWFFGLGPRPQLGRWTYWEKFDYFAVFWGVTIIGVTGLILWFPTTATRILPGWMINVATIIHSDEALLAAAFIFTVHFYNTPRSSRWIRSSSRVGCRLPTSGKSIRESTNGWSAPASWNGTS
jgi:cytochrome b subunit of formate dehydrogenase